MSRKYLTMFLSSLFRKIKWRRKGKMIENVGAMNSVHRAGVNCVFLPEYLAENNPQQTVSSKMVSEILLKYVA